MPPLPAALAALPSSALARVVGSMPEPMLRDWHAAFSEWAHGGQLAPDGDWRTWVIMGGRGFGKTRAGAEWVLTEVRAWGGRPPPGPASADAAAGRKDALRVALVAATVDEARAVMVEGPSGLLALAQPGEIARWSAAERRIAFANGAVAELFSGRSPQQLRGPEFDLAWCDELGKWKRAGEAWDMLQFGLRRGAHPRCAVTTTPSAEPALARVLAAAGTVVTGGATRANPHLAPGFVAAVTAAYAGTRLAGPEIEGLLPTDREGSLWPAALVARCRGAVAGQAAGTAPPRAQAGERSPSPSGFGEGWRRIVVGVDPPASAAGTCGIVVAGLDREDRAWVLADASVEGCSPEGWARAVARAAADWGADRVVAEANQGGDMVRSVLRAADAVLPLRLVHAARGKAARAEPVAALFESGRAGFAGVFPALEAELAQFTAGGWLGVGSPDRGDAMVWALWSLCLERRGAPGVRSLDF